MGSTEEVGSSCGYRKLAEMARYVTKDDKSFQIRAAAIGKPCTTADRQ